VGEVEGDLGDHVLLAADETAPSRLDQERPGVDLVFPGGGFGVARNWSTAGVAEAVVTVASSTT